MPTTRKPPALHIAYIGIGSNMGDKAANCRRALAAMRQSGVAEQLRVSPFYKTAPVDYLEQEWFVNAVAEIGTRLPPLKLLAALQAIQHKAGRVCDAIRFGPRVLDLDILLYDDLCIDEESLVVPHPRMHKRRFVLQPICDMNPSIVHPVLGRSMAVLLEALDDRSQRMVALR